MVEYLLYVCAGLVGIDIIKHIFRFIKRYKETQKSAEHYRERKYELLTTDDLKRLKERIDTLDERVYHLEGLYNPKTQLKS